MKQIPVKRLPVAVSLFKDYSEPFVFTKPVPSNPKIRNCLREFYKPNIENIQKIMDIKLTEEQADFIEHQSNLMPKLMPSTTKQFSFMERHAYLLRYMQETIKEHFWSL